MKRSILAALAALALCLGLAGTAWADDNRDSYEVTGGKIYLIEGLDNCFYVYACDESVTAADIPSEVVQQQEEGGTIVVPVVGINYNAFEGCTNLTHVSIPDSVMSIWGTAFRACPNLREITIAEENLFYVLHDGTLYNKEKTELVLPLDYKAVGSYTVPDGITTISERAFFGCTELTSVSIPASVKNIGKWAFVNCISLEDIYYGGTETQWEELLKLTGEYNEDLVSAIIHYNAAPAQTSTVSAAPTASTVLVNGELMVFDAYNIDGANYFKLRDIGALFDFGIGWDNDTRTITIDTASGYTE